MARGTAASPLSLSELNGRVKYRPLYTLHLQHFFPLIFEPRGEPGGRRAGQVATNVTYITSQHPWIRRSVYTSLAEKYLGFLTRFNACPGLDLPESTWRGEIIKLEGDRYALCRGSLELNLPL